MTDEPREVRFNPQGERKPPPGYIDVGGAFVKPAFKEFVEAAVDGRLPAPPDTPEQDPRVIALAEELMVIHLPEWRNPGGRKLAGPTVMKLGNALRVAEYLLERGVSFYPDQATIRWIPTPGTQLGASDLGKHLYRNPDGTWPEPPDPEEFWSVDDIECHQLPDGQWAAVHPRGIQCTDGSKTEAYSMCVQRVAAKISELKGQQ